MTDLKVVDFPAKAPAPLDINPSLIECLETMLSQAKEGKVVGLAAATMDDKNVVSYHKVGVHSFGTIGALQILQSRMIDHVITGDGIPFQ